MKICSRCKVEKPLDSFSIARGKKDGRNHSCRECHRKYTKAHYASDPKYYGKKARKWCAAKIAEMRSIIVEHLLVSHCVDCGERDIVVLYFDHIRGKKLFTISAFYNSGGTLSMKKLREEIEKCEVRCANCHRRATARRSNSYRWKITRPLGATD